MTQALQFPSSLSDKATAIIKSASKPKLDWKSVDVDSLPPQYRALYDDMRAAMAIVATKREAFEDALCGPLAKMLNAKPGQDVQFTYRFGLAVALADKTTPRSAALRF